MSTVQYLAYPSSADRVGFANQLSEGARSFIFKKTLVEMHYLKKTTKRLVLQLKFDIAVGAEKKNRL